MNKTVKIVVIALICFVIAAVVLIPRLLESEPLNDAAIRDPEKETAVDRSFAPTPQAFEAYNDARLNEQPIFLEFYARW